MTAKHGFRGLYSGVAPNIVRNALINTFEMIGYDQTKELVATYTNLNAEASHMYPFYGLVSGIVAGLLVNPIDVVKVVIYLLCISG